MSDCPDDNEPTVVWSAYWTACEERDAALADREAMIGALENCQQLLEAAREALRAIAAVQNIGASHSRMQAIARSALGENPPCPSCGRILFDATGDYQCHFCEKLWPRAALGDDTPTTGDAS